MSRLRKYKESLINFIKSINQEECIPDDNINSLIYNKICDGDKLLSILFLTIMNNQNKKKQITVQGYYIASIVEFLSIIINMVDSREKNINTYNVNTFYKIINFLILCANKSLHDNFDTLKNTLSGKKTDKIILNLCLKISSVYNDTISYKNLFEEYDFVVLNEKPKDDTLRWYLKNDCNIKSHFNQIKKIDKKSLLDYIDCKFGNLCKLAINIGWLMGCGDHVKLKFFDKMAKYFAIIYKLSNDFNSIEEDICNNDGTTTNYVINMGLEESYELFMESKQKFIQEVMVHDMYTNTIKEIINYIEGKVEAIIDQTSPDLKSNLSIN